MKLIGGYTSKMIPFKAKEYLEDSNAFIFTITGNKKFKVK